MLNRRHDLEMLQAQVPGMGGPISGTSSTEDIGDLKVRSPRLNLTNIVGFRKRSRWAGGVLATAGTAPAHRRNGDQEMTQEQKIIRAKVGLLEELAEPTSVTSVRPAR